MVELLTNTLCPACGKELRTVYVPEADINVDICLNGCGGVYFSKKEVWNFDKVKNNIDILLSQFKRKHFTETSEDSVRLCPSCGKKMVKFGIPESDARLDMCYSCGGRFLAHDELIKLCSVEYDNSRQPIGTSEDSAPREYYKVLYFSGSSSMRQYFEDWVKTYM